MVKTPKHSTVETNVSSIAALAVIEMCEAGRYRKANEAVAAVAKDTPVGLLAHGIVAVQQRDLETAKDLLSSVGFGENEFTDLAKYHLAAAYWHGGEAREALDLLRVIPDSFLKLLLKAIIEDRAKLALKILDKAARFQVRAGLQARLHNERGKKLRKLGKLDRAIQEYEAAIYFFEQDESDCTPFVVNNLARVYLEYGEFRRAHQQVDKAIALLADDLPHLGQAYDEKSRIFLAQKKPGDAKRWSEKAVSVLRAAERREWLVEALITKAKAQRLLSQPCNAALHEAEEIGRYLQRDDLMIDVYALRTELAQDELEQWEKQLIRTALDVCGSFRAAAERLGVSHPHISKLARKYALKNLPSRIENRKSLV